MFCKNCKTFSVHKIELCALDVKDGSLMCTCRACDGGSMQDLKNSYTEDSKETSLKERPECGSLFCSTWKKREQVKAYLSFLGVTAKYFITGDFQKWIASLSESLLDITREIIFVCGEIMQRRWLSKKIFCGVRKREENICVILEQLEATFHSTFIFWIFFELVSYSCIFFLENYCKRRTVTFRKIFAFTK